MCCIDLEIKFHPVGFGLFSSGRIGNFRYVYDCGSTNEKDVENCVEEEFKKEKKLDLLVISHFHKDHISGIKKLLDTVNEIENIVLPYFTPDERLNFILYYYNFLYQKEDSWILNFLLDPISFISNFENIKNIILIKGNSDKNNDDDESNYDNKSQNDTNKFFLDFSKLEKSEDENQIKNSENITDSKVSIKKSGKVYLYKKLKYGNSYSISQLK